MTTKKTKPKTSSTKAKAPNDVLQAKGIEAKAALERTRLEAEAKVQDLKAKIKDAGANAKSEIEKRIAELKGDHKKPQAKTKTKKARKEVSAA